MYCHCLYHGFPALFRIERYQHQQFLALGWSSEHYGSLRVFQSLDCGLRGRLKVRDGDAGVRIYGVTAANGDRLLIVTEK